MKKFGYLLLLVIYLLIQSCNNKIEITPLMFEVKSEYNTVYIFGSIHTADESVYPLPDYVMDRFSNSKKLIFEIDPRSFDPLLYNSSFYDEKDDISNHISNDTYNLLISYCRETGNVLEDLSKYKPFQLSNEIIENELNRADITLSLGIEVYFANEVKNKEIKIGGIESYEESLFRHAQIDSADLDKYLYYTLDTKDEIIPDMINMLNNWKTGNTKVLVEYLNEENEDYPSMTEYLQEEKDKIIVNEIEKYLSECEPVFVIVGLAHLILENSVVDILKSKDYHVTLIQSDT